jgi:hypothetical protein
MYGLLFTLLFQGLAVFAALCLILAILKLIPKVPTQLNLFLMNLLSPIVSLIAIITPTIVPPRLHLLFAAFWLLVLRVGVYLAASAYGLLPVVTP